MSDSVVTLELLIENAEGAKTVGELKKAVKDLQNAALEAEKAGNGILSDKFLAAAGKAKGELKDLKEKINALDPDNRFGSFAKIGQGIAGGFQAATGAMALFGIEGEEVQKTLLKVQAATALAQGIQSIEGLKDGFSALNAVMKANPILAIVAGFTALAGVVTAFAYSLAGATKEQEQLLELSKEQKEVADENLKIYQGQHNQFLASGKTQKQFIEGEMVLMEIAIEKQAQWIANKNEQIKMDVIAAQKYHDYLKTAMEFLSAPLLLITRVWDKLFGTDYTEQIKEWSANLLFDPKKTQEEGDKMIKESLAVLNTQKEQLQGFKNEMVAIDKKAYDDRVKNAVDFKDQLIEIEKESIPDLVQLESDKLQAIFEVSDESRAKHKAQILAEEKLEAQRKLQTEQNYFNASKALSDTLFNVRLGHVKKGSAEELKIKKQQFEVNKALSVAEATINGIQSVSKTLAEGGAFAIPLAVSMGVMALANVAKILSVKFDGGGGGADTSLSGGAGTFSGGASVNPVTNNSTLLNPDGTPKKESDTPIVKAYVTETDLTMTQKKISSIKSQATF